MIEIKKLRTNLADYKARYTVRNMSEQAIQQLDHILELDDQRVKIQNQLDDLLNQRNKKSEQIGGLFRSGKAAEAEQMKAEVTEVNDKISALDTESKAVKEELEDILLALPNVPHPSVPKGKSDADNVIVKDWPKELPNLGENDLPHWDLAKKYNLFDLALGAKLAGAGFVVYRGKGAAMQRALISFFLSEAIKAGYEEIIPPLLVNAETARGTGQLPDKEGQMYHVTKDELYLIPTSEVPLANIYRDVILNEEDFPIKVTGYTPCFRREAGSYGAHVKGLNRVHQFDKIEIVQITKPEKSYEALDGMVAHVESLLVKLGLPYRIVRLCGGDLGQSATMTYDFEVYSAAQGRWLEVSSISNTETYQANRMKVRYKKNKKNVLAHTLNGSALALARIVAALMENFQTADGIKVPDVLVKYTGFDTID